MARFTHPAIITGGISGLSVPHGSFVSLTTQQAQTAGVKQAVMFEETLLSQGITMENGIGGYPSQITFENPGVYNIAFSGQLHHVTGGGGGAGSSVFIWFEKNGQKIPDSNTKLSIDTGNYAVAAWNIFVEVESGDYIELVGYPETVDVVLEYIPSNGTYPASPSVILTVNQVA